MAEYIERKKKNNLVAYKNEFNTVPLRNFNAVEMDLLFSILSAMKDEGLAEISFDFDELKELSQYQPTAKERFIDDLKRTYKKIINLDVMLENNEEIVNFILFTEYRIDKENETVTIKMNSNYSYLINELAGNFTKFELEEMTTLNSSYSKSAYRLLKQFRKTGFYRVSIGEFRRLMDIPESYKMYNIRQKVFKQLEKELPEYFENFNIHEVKGKGKKKRSTVELLFTFTPEYDLKTDPSGKVYISTKDKDGEYKNVYAEDMNSNQIESVYESADDYQKKYLSDLIQLKKDQIKFDDF